MGKNKMSNEEKLIKGLRILLIKIPLIIWIALLLIVFYIYPLSGIFFAVVSSVIMIPLLLFLNWFIK